MKCKCCFAIAEKDGYCAECRTIIKAEKIFKRVSPEPETMKHYIFLSSEGVCYEPNEEGNFIGVDNLQVIGTTTGNTPAEAFENLKKCVIEDISFDEVFSYELKADYEKTSKVFYLKKEAIKR